MSADDPLQTPRATRGRAPDVFRPGGWVPMREHRDAEEVDFVIVGTGAGGGTLACKLAEHGFSVVAMDAGPYFRPLEDFASDESEQSKLYWTDDRISDGENPVQLGSNNSGKAVGGSTVHFAMASLRFRPECFKARTALGYGFDWPLDWREMWEYYTEVPGRKRRSPRFPRRAAKRRLACTAASAPWAAPPTRSRARSLPGFPRAIAAEAEIRDLAMVGRVEVGADGLATGVHYHREGQWRFQRARNVVVAGYAIETPRRLLNSATGRFPQGLANSSGLVGKYLTVQANQAVWGAMEQEVRSYKGPPSLTIQAIACRTGDRIRQMARRGEL